MLVDVKEKPIKKHFNYDDSYTILDCRYMERTKKSLCCDSPIDFSHVITHGLNRGHGPRVCTNCKSILYVA